MCYALPTPFEFIKAGDLVTVHFREFKKESGDAFIHFITQSDMNLIKDFFFLPFLYSSLRALGKISNNNDRVTANVLSIALSIQDIFSILINNEHHSSIFQTKS